MAADVSTPCTAFLAMQRDWFIIDALMGGTREMRAKGQAFLPQEPKESNTAYAVRVQHSFLKPALRNAIQSGKGAVFRYEVDISGVHPKLAPMLDDVDMQGNDLTSFLANAFGDMLTYGHCHLLAAYPNMSPEATQADATIYGIRPYGVRLDPRNVFSWRKATDVEHETAGEVRFYERVPAEGRGEWDTDSERLQVKVLRRGEWQEWSTQSVVQAALPGEAASGPQSSGIQGSGWAMTASGVIGVEELPLTTIYADRVDFMVSRPPFLDLAWLNLAHWQSYSDHRHILHVVQVPHLFGSGMRDDGNGITIGISSATLAEDPAANLRWVEHSGKAIESGRQALVDLEAAMEKLGSALLSEDKKPGIQTATAEAIETAQEQATLGGIVRALEDGANQFLWHMGQWLGLDDIGEVVIRRPVAMGGNQRVVPDGDTPQRMMQQAAE